MSYAVIATAIQEFLRSDRPGVLCISGPWGVGKTFAWRKIVEQEGRAGNISFQSYAYVSLFGMATFEDLKREIFAKTVPSNTPLLSASPSSIASQLDKVASSAKSHVKSASKFFGEKGQAFSDLLTEISFASIFERLICFDDLERCGKDVEVRDVLGLAYHLAEEKRCKVVILLNDEKFDQTSKDVFDEQFEKVVDAFIRYLPTSAESAAIAFDQSRFPGSEMAQVFEAVGCTNIRVMKKAEAIYQIVESSALNDEERKQFANTVALASFVRFQFEGDESLEKLRGYNEIVSTLREDKPGDDVPIYDAISKTGYVATDEVDLFLIDAVRNGYVERKEFDKALKTSREQRHRNRDDDLFSRAWATYHDSLHHEPEDVVNALAEAMQREPESISPQNANATLNFMDRLGFENLADAAAAAYFEKRGFGFRELEQDPFLWREGPTNPRVQEFYDQKKAAFVDDREPADVIAKMVKDRGWNEEDIGLLNTLSTEKIVDMIGKLEGKDLTRSLRFLRAFVDSDTDAYQPFGERLKAAFKDISERSTSVSQKLAAEKLI